MPFITEHARAKVNLTLRVLGRRGDGYHELESLVAFADAGDVITLDLDAPLGVRVSGPFGASIAGENLVRVTLDKLSEAEPGLRLGAVTLEKRLPVAAGIGGGSADAAAVLRAIRRANPDLADRVDWLGLASKLGADVPVCVHNGPAMMRGTGELLTPVDCLPPLDVVLVNPQVPVPADKTARVFCALAAAPVDPSPAPCKQLTLNSRAALLAFMASVGNDLLPPSLGVVPEIHDVMAALKACDGAEHVALSGGGPTCFAVFPDAASAHAATNQLHTEYPDWWAVATKLS